MKILGTIFGLLALLLVGATPAQAAHLSTFGGATLSGHNAMLVSDLSNASTTDDFSGVGVSIPSGMLFSNLSHLSTGYNVGDDDCMGGSPRFQIHLDTPSGVKTMFVYLGPTPNFTGCASGDQTTGNLVNSSDARFDLTQFGGPFYGTYADALNLVGSSTVLGVQVVADSGWAFADQEQTVTVMNPQVRFKVASAKDQCKNGGWMAFTSPTFKNQGQCVSTFARM